MSRRAWEQAYGTHAAFYRDVYGQHLAGVYPVGSVGATLIERVRSAGDWSDTPTPDLTIAWLLTRCEEISMDLSAARFRGVQRSGDAILVASHVGSSIQMHGAHCCRVLTVPYRRFLDMTAGGDERLPQDSDFGLVNAGLLKDAFLTQLLERFWTEVSTGGPTDALFFDGLLPQIAALLLTIAVDARPERAIGGRSLWRVCRVTECLEAHLAQDLPLVALAQLVDLSPNHFCTAFRISMGEPPHRWLVRRRIERATELLRDAHFSVTVGPLSIGFGSSAHFATASRKHVGVNPSANRREIRS